jgi:hypothetical protein
MMMIRSRRLLIAFVIALLLNGILMATGASIKSEQNHPSTTEKVLEALSKPSAAFSEWLVPPGHDAAYFIGGAEVSIVFSVLFYAALVWVIISLPAWWRDRQ